MQDETLGRVLYETRELRPYRWESIAEIRRLIRERQAAAARVCNSD